MLRSLVGSEMCMRDGGLAASRRADQRAGAFEARIESSKLVSPVKLTLARRRGVSCHVVSVSYTHLTLPTKRIV